MIESENQRAEFATVEPTGYTFFQLAFRRKNVCLFGTGEAFAGNDDNATFVLQVSFLYKAENGLKGVVFTVTVQIKHLFDGKFAALKTFGHAAVHAFGIADGKFGKNFTPVGCRQVDAWFDFGQYHRFGRRYFPGGKFADIPGNFLP